MPDDSTAAEAEDHEPDRGTEPDLFRVLADLRLREPIFHGPFWDTREKFIDLTADDFWEVGASGRRYSRDYVWSVLAERLAHPQVDDQWEAHDFQVRATGSSTYLLTYTLTQGARVTRRLSVWKRRENRWAVLYHQGTDVVD